MGVPLKIAGWFHGKSQSKIKWMITGGYLHEETSIYI